MWFDINHWKNPSSYWKNPSSITKYFDKQIKIKFYVICYISYRNMKNNVMLGHVDFFQNSLDIINKNIFHYLMSKISKKIFI